MGFIIVDTVEVGLEDVRATLRIADSRRFRSSPQVAEKLLEVLPGLARHTCENEAHSRFVDEMRDTETAHLVEHVACEFMALAGSPRSLRGETVWDFGRDGHGVFSVRLRYDDDLVAIGALDAAVRTVEWAFGHGESQDVAQVAARLTAVRGTGGA